MKLVEKLCEIMATVTYIQKRGKNTHFGYKYATEADVSDAIRKELVKHKVFMLPSQESTTQREIQTKAKNTETITKVRIVYTFLDAESDETLQMTMEGEGQDPGDKGIYKAITGATKYALMKAFLIPTGDDPEGDSGVDERNKDRESVTEEDPFGDNPLPTHTGKLLPPAGTKGINDARAIIGHALKLGWTEEQLAEWVEKRTGGTLEDIKAAQAKALLQAIKQEKETIDV